MYRERHIPGYAPCGIDAGPRQRLPPACLQSHEQREAAVRCWSDHAVNGWVCSPTTPECACRVTVRTDEGTSERRRMHMKSPQSADISSVPIALEIREQVRSVQTNVRTERRGVRTRRRAAASRFRPAPMTFHGIDGNASSSVRAETWRADAYQTALRA